MNAMESLDRGPLVIAEEIVSPFKFLFQEKIYDGMLYRQDIFRLLNTYDARRRERVYNLGYALAEQGRRVVITHSRDRYKIWLNLRDPWNWNSEKTEITSRTNSSTDEQLILS